MRLSKFYLCFMFYFIDVVFLKTQTFGEIVGLEWTQSHGKAWVFPLVFILAYMFSPTWDRRWEGDWFIYHSFLTLFVMSYVFWDVLTTCACAVPHQRSREPYFFYFFVLTYSHDHKIRAITCTLARTSWFVVSTGDVLKAINAAFPVQKRYRTSFSPIFFKLSLLHSPCSWESSFL